MRIAPRFLDRNYINQFTNFFDLETIGPECYAVQLNWDLRFGLSLGAFVYLVVQLFVLYDDARARKLIFGHQVHDGCLLKAFNLLLSLPAIVFFAPAILCFTLKYCCKCLCGGGGSNGAASDNDDDAGRGGGGRGHERRARIARLKEQTDAEYSRNKNAEMCAFFLVYVAYSTLTTLSFQAFQLSDWHFVGVANVTAGTFVYDPATNFYGAAHIAALAAAGLYLLLVSFGFPVFISAKTRGWRRRGKLHDLHTRRMYGSLYNARRDFAEHFFRSNALHCTDTARVFIPAQCSAVS